MNVVDHKGVALGFAVVMIFTHIRMVGWQVIMAMRHQFGIM